MSEQQALSAQTTTQVGNYRLLHLLGRGGQACVFLAEHVYLKTAAALKILPAGQSAEHQERFLAAARLLARLQHPHIIPLLEYGPGEGRPYLVMEYAPGGTLRQRFPRGSRLALAEILAFVSQLAGAVQYIHDQGLLHLDLKPENMLIGEQQQVLLSDLHPQRPGDLSQITHQSPGQAFGTLAYMAPEQIQGTPCPASDQYALAAVVYEWLCGAPPFQGPATSVAARHLLAPPPPLRVRLPQAPALAEVIMRGLAKDPQQRFASVQAFASALQQAALEVTVLRDVPLAVLPPATWRHGPGRRQVVALGLAGLGVIAGGAAALVVLAQGSRLGPPALLAHPVPSGPVQRLPELLAPGSTVLKVLRRSVTWRGRPTVPSSPRSQVTSHRALPRSGQSCTETIWSACNCPVFLMARAWPGLLIAPLLPPRFWSGERSRLITRFASLRRSVRTVRMGINSPAGLWPGPLTARCWPRCRGA